MRAIAVLAVIALHLGVLPGGYLGVDVFFVLSGFLITSLLIDEWDKRGGSIRFRDFYARRARRILPASTLVLVVTVVLSSPLPGAAEAPEGFPWPEAPPEPDVFAPDYAPDEIAETVLFLLSDAASYITGAVIEVAGGIPLFTA